MGCASSLFFTTAAIPARVAIPIVGVPFMHWTKEKAVRFISFQQMNPTPLQSSQRTRKGSDM